MGPIQLVRRALPPAAAGFTGLMLLLAPSVEAAPKCFGKRATLVTSAKKVVGRKGHDVIVVKGGGRHRVNGMGGNDRICGSPGDDFITGFRGNDRIDGGGGDDTVVGFRGNDELSGGGGDDTVRGVQGSDRLSGGSGSDRLFGDKGNDRMKGDAGDDLLEASNGDDLLAGGTGDDTLIGASGGDQLRGGAGADVLRGEGVSDLLDGGPGEDIASYSSSSGPVQVDLRRAGEQWTREGNDTLRSIEDLVGSPFADTLRGDGADNRIDGGPGYDLLAGGGGSDVAYGGADGAECDGFAERNNCGKVEAPGAGTVVLLSKGLDGDSLVVTGDDRGNDITVSRNADGYVVTDAGPSGVWTGSREETGCVADGGSRGSRATCAGGDGLNFVLVTGNVGSDTLRVAGDVPRGVQVRLNGGEDGDTLYGGSGNDVLEAGYPYRIKRDGGRTSGSDTLFGGAGTDALFADPGPDSLSGQQGTDLLVSSPQVCQGHRLSGGAGKDTASWSHVHPVRSGYRGRMRMQIGGTGGPVGCKSLDRVGGDVENLEGSRLGDLLIGTRGGNGFLGWEGPDIFRGRGGKDYIDAADGERDIAIDCGGGRESTVLRDARDPSPRRC